jgi:hypothetical protein
MKKNVYITIILCAVPVFFANAYTFTRTLSLGSTGEDVFMLQKVLNSDSNTRIADTGTGSPGNETRHFGQKTKQAVIKFQNLHATEILHPNGLSQGTGFVGKSTLSFLNTMQIAQTIEENLQSEKPLSEDMKKIADKVQTEQEVSLEIQKIAEETIRAKGTTTSEVIGQKERKVPEFLVSKTKVKADTMLYVGSQHDISNANFYLGSKEMNKDCPKNIIYSCKIHVDKDTKPGIYPLHTDTKSWGEYDITILDSSEKKPKVDIDKVNLNKSTLIKGKDFSKNMMVYTMFGVFKTETKNNSFILEFPKSYVRAATTTKEGMFYLENENGLSSDILKIRYEI